MPDEQLLKALRIGALHSFSDFHDIEDLPRTGAGVYTIWDQDGQLVYVGIAGRNLTGKGLHGRLKSPLSRPPKRRPVLRLCQRSIRPAAAHGGGAQRDCLG